MSLSSLATLSSGEVFALIGEIEVCPLCGGRGCAARLSVYWRRVIDENSLELSVPVPRFACHDRGPRRRLARTFSLLPAEVIPRRRWSLGWVLRVIVWVTVSQAEALRELSEAGQAIEHRQLRRWLKVLGIAVERLRQHPVSSAVQVETAGSRQQQAGALRRAFEAWQTAGRGSPGMLVMAWQERWQSLLFDIKLS